MVAQVTDRRPTTWALACGLLAAKAAGGAAGHALVVAEPRVIGHEMNDLVKLRRLTWVGKSVAEGRHCPS